MYPCFKFGWSAAIALSLLQALTSQELAPRAYVITPVHANVNALTYAFYDGSIDYNDVAPISGATGTYSVPIFSYYHALAFFGRSANDVASLPYADGLYLSPRGFPAESQAAQFRASNAAADQWSSWSV